MPRYGGTLIDRVNVATYQGAGVDYVVRTPDGVFYIVYIDAASDVVWCKSDDNGISWTDPVVIFAGTATNVAVWYDRWSGISAGLIHVAYNESALDDDIKYRTINTESSDALSTQTVVAAGLSAVLAGSSISITRSRGGNVYVKTIIDAGAEGGFYRLPNANVPAGAWDAARTNTEALATLDQYILVPGFAADDQDIMCIFWDVSNNEISRYIYDDSANTWAETSISTGMVEQNAATAWPHFAAAVDLTNSRVALIAWNGIDTANADLKCWTVTESAITAKTDVVTNGTDDQGLAAIVINEDDPDHWWAFYVGKSDGSETYPTAVNIYCKGTKDGGTTWGPETQISSGVHPIRQLIGTPRATDGRWGLAYYNDITNDQLVFIATLTQPRSASMLGI